jgi:hypothetical protein
MRLKRLCRVPVLRESRKSAIIKNTRQFLAFLWFPFLTAKSDRERARDVMTQHNKGKSGKPSTEQPPKGTEKPGAKPGGPGGSTKPSPQFPDGIETIGHGGGSIRTTVEVPVKVPKLPTEPSHGGGGIRPPKPPTDK